jgi:hypothetical protein
MIFGSHFDWRGTFAGHRLNRSVSELSSCWGEERSKLKANRHLSVLRVNVKQTYNVKILTRSALGHWTGECLK